MKRDNTLSIQGYIGAHLFWAFVSSFWYNRLYFRKLAPLTYNQSRGFLCVLLVLVCTVGIVVTYKRHRNYKSMILNLIMAYGLYAFATYSRIFPTKIMWTLIISLSLTTIWIIILFCRKINNENKRKTIIKIRINRALLAIRNGLCAAIIIVMLPIGVKVLFDGTISSSGVPATNTYGNEYTISENIEKLTNINQEKWDTLSVQEKLDVCQIIANIEANYFGIEQELYVEMGELGKDVNGHYESDSHKIVINTEHIMESPAAAVINTICHEAYHSYQFRLVELYDSLDEKNRSLKIFYKSSIYSEEFKNYISGDEDLEAYYSQDIEYDARKYAKSAVEDYYARINEYFEIE